MFASVRSDSRASRKVSFLEGVELLLFEEGEDRRLAAEPDLVIARHAVQLAHPVVHLVERSDVRADLLGRDVRDEEKVLGLVELACRGRARRPRRSFRAICRGRRRALRRFRFRARARRRGLSSSREPLGCVRSSFLALVAVVAGGDRRGAVRLREVSGACGCERSRLCGIDWPFVGRFCRRGGFSRRASGRQDKRRRASNAVRSGAVGRHEVQFNSRRKWCGSADPAISSARCR